MQLKKLVQSTFLALSLFGATSAMAELNVGTNEVGFSASLLSFDDIDDDVWSLYGTYGLMFKENIQLKGSLVWFSVAGDDFLFLGAGADYIFPETNEIIPYVGGVFNLALMDAEDETIELHAGIKHFVSERASVYGQYNIVDSLGDFGDYTELRFGLNVYF
ncbi:MAG TPA: hypothetical protein VIM41_11305 [Gammaproteobacteria bacterium]